MQFVHHNIKPFWIEVKYGKSIISSEEIGGYAISSRQALSRRFPYTSWHKFRSLLFDSNHFYISYKRYSSIPGNLLVMGRNCHR